MADTHYSLETHPDELARAEFLIARFNALNCDAIINLGDIYEIDTSATSKTDYNNSNPLLEGKWNAFNNSDKIWWVLGNHDFESGVGAENVPIAYFVQECEYMTSENYTVDFYNTWQLISYSNADKIGGVYTSTADTRTWLTNAIEAARVAGKSIVIACHYPPQWAAGPNYDAVSKAAEIGIFETGLANGAEIKLVLAGHSHSNQTYDETVNGIRYVTFYNFADAFNGPSGPNWYGWIDFQADGEVHNIYTVKLP